MVKRLVWLQLSIFVIAVFVGCGTKDDSPIQVIREEMKLLPDEGIILVEGEVENVSEQPKLAYIYVSIYGDMGMVKDNRKRLLNGGLAMEPGDKLEFSMQFDYDDEVKKSKSRVEAVDPK